VQKIIFYIVYTLLWMITLLPMRVLYVISDIFFIITYFIAGYRKKIVRKNMAVVFPQKTKAELKRIEIKFYRHFCDQIIETLALVHLNKNQMKKRVTFKNLDKITQYKNEGRDTVMCLAHYGNWEWITSMPNYLQNIVVTSAYRPLQNKLADNLMKKIREKYGTVVSPMKIYFKTLLEMRNNNRPFIGTLIADQSAPTRDGRIWIDFFGRETNFFVGPGKMSVKLKTAVIFLRVNRLRRGYYEGEIIELTSDASKNNEEEIMAMYVEQLERLITEQPQYWLWSHNRWKRTREQSEHVIKRTKHAN